MPRISIIDDEPSILSVLEQFLSGEGYEVSTYDDPRQAIDALEQFRPELVISDLKMPKLHGIDVLRAVKKFNPETNVIVMTAYASLSTAVEAIREGALDYVVKPFQLEDLKPTLQRAFHEKRLVPEMLAKDRSFQAKYSVKNMVGRSPAMLEIHKLIEKSALTSSTVLITGESGTGKELVARAIHFNSKRKQKPFVSINCAALPETLLESELFGYDKGAFTGAITTKEGLLELAHKGTFFMDEVGEITPPIQVKLLRALQERVVKHIGGLKDISVDVRIVAATSRDLREAVVSKMFRHELYYRLNVIPIHLPPLRERKEDIAELTHYFMEQFVTRNNLSEKFTITHEALDSLNSYHWPGNIRELENVVERLLALSDVKQISAKDVDSALRAETTADEASPNQGTGRSLTCPLVSEDGASLRNKMESYERDLIQSALKKHNGNKLRAAKELGLSRQNLQYKLAKWNLEG